MSERPANERKRHIISPLITKFLRLKTPEDNLELNSSHAIRKVDYYSSYAIVPTSKSAQEFILIDGGKDPKAKRLQQFLANRGLDLSAIKALYLTHGHNDHTGAAHILPANVPVYISAADSRITAGKLTQGPLPNLFDKLARKPLSRIAELQPEIMQQGEVHTYGDIRIFSLDMPGHTDGSTSYLVDGYQKNGMLDWFAGDALDTKRNGKVANAAPPFSHDLQLSALSICRAVQYIHERNWQISQVMPAHTGVTSFEAVEQFADEAARNSNQT